MGISGDTRDISYCVWFMSMTLLTNMETVHTMRYIDEIKYLWEYVGVCIPL